MEESKLGKSSRTSPAEEKNVKPDGAYVQGRDEGKDMAISPPAAHFPLLFSNQICRSMSQNRRRSEYSFVVAFPPILMICAVIFMAASIIVYAAVFFVIEGA
ncbi:hypothetical protein FPCIR_13965 [Fusarium pseudocircinatum]|uniref:Uncharacterized protein n=1 Tax=Fusarium pseudocircinatum TaxID=56676 RepID=A0A8H5KHM4_9HYPO|nr:hypothetical protein FPCIR_13965 [Fusarium pseudocircinatum]